jgi:uncharacterized membrane protein (DUF106 family)
MTWELIIPVIAAVLSVLAIGVELLMHDREKAKSVEFGIRRKQAEIKKYQKEKNTKAMMEANKELMGLMSKNFKLRSKTMLISFPLFIVLFWVLSGMLNIAPLYAGQTSEIGAEIRNLDQSPQNVVVEIVSPDVQVSGENTRTIELDDKGDEGDKQQLWWKVTAPEGARTYSVKVTSNNKSDEKSYTLSFAPPGTLTAGFSQEAPSELLGKSLAVTPVYKAVEANLGVITLPWFWYYLISYFITSAALSPLKNKLLWGHRKGVKHLEKLDREGKAPQ